MTIERPPSVEFGEVHGTFGEVLELVTLDRQSVMRVNRHDLLLIGETLLIQRAVPEIALNDCSKLSVYEKRSAAGSIHGETLLTLDLGAATSMTLTEQSAHQLACALLAYSKLGNRGSNWLVRVE